jgi:hypothetical protein
VVLRLLTGAAPSQHLAENFSNKLIFDWRQMVRWGISEGRLAANSEIYFREKTVQEQYWWQIMLIRAHFTVLFSRNACYARMNRNLGDGMHKRTNIPESIFTSSLP